MTKLNDIVLTAFLYIVFARIGQAFAIEPGNVTPVWIPSGIMLALTLYRGKHIWPGVFIGAFIGNIWAYFSASSVSSMLSAVAAATLNGIGDVISCVVIAEVIRAKTNENYPFTTVKSFLWYLWFGVLLGPIPSALLGTVGLVLFGFSSTENLITVFITWYIGDATGVMLFGPLLLSWLVKDKFNYRFYYPVLTLLIIYTLILSTLSFSIVRVEQWIILLVTVFLPAAFFTVFYYGQRTAFLVLNLVSGVAVWATSTGKGPFALTDPNLSLMKLQAFIALTSINVYALAIFIFEKQSNNARLESQKVELERLYRQDQLTRIWNRYRIKEFIDLELSRFQRSSEPFGLIMFDIDDFKVVNDKFGHSTGDNILKEVCERIRNHIREVDLFGRWGGEEFVIVITNTREDGLAKIAEKVRSLVADHPFGNVSLISQLVAEKLAEKSGKSNQKSAKKLDPSRLNLNVTISVGATMVRPKDTLLQLIDRADASLYLAKQHGKNQVNIG